MTALLPARRPLTLAIVTAAIAAPTLAQTPPEPPIASPTFNVQFLPLGPGVTESRAGGAATLGDSGDFVIGGSINAGGGWDPTLWKRGDDGLSLPIRLGQPGLRGHVNAVANALTDGGDVIAVGRSKPMGLASVAATVWFAKYDGIDGESNDAVRVLLPTPDGATSEATDVVVTHFAGDEWDALIIGGRITSGGVDRAALWRTTSSLLEFEVQMLHGATDAASSIATDIAVCPNGDLLVAGNTIGTDGTTRPARWVIDAASDTVTFSNLNLPHHTGTAIVGDWNGAFYDTIGAGGAHGYADIVAPKLGRTDATGDTTFQSLPLPPGQTGGNVNGIIAILIGLLVPGHTTGPAGQSACIWIDQPGASPTVLDLNTAARNLPLGTRLNTVQAVEPPVEQVSFVFHNITWFGAATTAGGRERAFIARPARRAVSADQLGERD